MDISLFFSQESLFLVLFIAGVIVGLLGFAKILKWILSHYHDQTIAILTGFMIGSLNKVWPWKETLSTRINSEGEEVPLLQESVLPGDFSGEPFLMAAIGLAVLGFVVIILLDKFGPEEETSPA